MDAARASHQTAALSQRVERTLSFHSDRRPESEQISDLSSSQEVPPVDSSAVSKACALCGGTWRLVVALAPNQVAYNRLSPLLGLRLERSPPEASPLHCTARSVHRQETGGLRQHSPRQTSCHVGPLHHLSCCYFAKMHRWKPGRRLRPHRLMPLPPPSRLSPVTSSQKHLPPQ